MTTTDPTLPGVRRAAIDRALAARLAAGEYDRMLTVLRNLEPSSWTMPTDCPGWDVRSMAGHVLGMTRMAASLRETLRQDRIARKDSGRGGGSYIDALTDLQVREQAGLGVAGLVERFAEAGPRAAHARASMPGLLRRMPLRVAQDVGGRPERWSNGYLVDVILTRDTWMHRMDIARATGQTPELTAEHDGLLVADVVAEWAQRHGQAYRLELTGPAGGGFGHDDAPVLVMDAVDFCRVLSGRQPGTPVEHVLLGAAVPF